MDAWEASRWFVDRNEVSYFSLRNLTRALRFALRLARRSSWAQHGYLVKCDQRMVWWLKHLFQLISSKASCNSSQAGLGRLKFWNLLEFLRPDFATNFWRRWHKDWLSVLSGAFRVSGFLYEDVTLKTFWCVNKHIYYMYLGTVSPSITFWRILLPPRQRRWILHPQELLKKWSRRQEEKWKSNFCSVKIFFRFWNTALLLGAGSFTFSTCSECLKGMALHKQFNQWHVHLYNFSTAEGWRFLNSICEDGSGSELDQCRRLLD